MPYFVLFDDAINNSAQLYQEYKYSQFIKPTELNKLDNFLQQGWNAGLHAVIFTDYEFGFTLQQLPAKSDAYLSLHWFAKKITLNKADDWLAAQYDSSKPAGISTINKDTSQQAYLDSIDQIKQAIADGATYQINYTIRLHLLAYGNPIKLYQRLRQPVPFAVVANLPDASSKEYWTLSFSPELFLNIDTDGLIKTKPMKGTAPALDDGNDQARAKSLSADPKNRAENIMIVDLLRNDLSKIAQLGSVTVSDLFNVSRFGNVLQMTTTVKAQPLPQTGLAEIFAATFPCGSITGAPKRKSMQLIDALESSKRGLYTGTIGWLEKCNTGLGFFGNLNIAIRTLQLWPRNTDTYSGIYGVGSGIVVDSVGTNEYEECDWKASFLNQLQPEFSLFETMRVQNKQCALLNLHLNRLDKSALATNIQFNKNQTLTAFKKYLAKLPDNGTYRVKITLSNNGETSISSTKYQPLDEQQSVLIAKQKLSKHNYLRRFKTSNRAIYDIGWQQALQHNAFDSLFFNHDNYLLEGGRSSVFIRMQEQWYTPPLTLDILDGVMRQQVINNSLHYLNSNNIKEDLISYEMLLNACEIRLCNALHGIFTVNLKTDL